jgi:hypothetical protein
VAPRAAEATARSIAAAVDDFLAHPPEPAEGPVRARRSFQEELLWSYERVTSGVPG